MSYSSSDRWLVELLVEALETDGWSVWWDREVDVGQEFDRQIDAALAEADCVVVVWSRDAITSKWVRSEALAGFERERLVPVALDSSLSIPVPFNRLHTASLEGWTGDLRHPGLAELARGMRAVAEREGRADEQAPARDPESEVRLAVLPFDDMGIGESTHLRLQLPDALIKALSQFSNLVVLSRRASFDPGLEGLEVKALARTLRVGYVITGAVAEIGAEIEISLELCDGRTGRQLWTGSYRRSPDAMRSLADVAADMARALSGAFIQLALETADEQSEQPRHLVGSGRKLLLRSTPEAIRMAQAKARRALELEPDNGHALGLLASALVEEIVNGHTDDIEAGRAEAIESVDRALVLCVDDPIVLKYAGYALSCCGEHAQGVQALRRGLELNPHDDGAYGYLGWGLAPSTSAEHLDEIVPILRRLLEQSRKHPGRPFWNLHLSVALTCRGDFDGAYEAAREALAFSPGMSLAGVHCLNALGHLSRASDAQALIRRYRLDLSPLLPRVAPILKLLSRDDDAFALRTDGLRALALI